MASALRDFFNDDHARVMALFSAVESPARGLDVAAFDAFRGELLRHIAAEERVVLPALVACLGVAFAPTLRRIRQDHQAMVALTVPFPCAEWLEDLREFLVHHFDAEALDDGLHALVERHLAADARRLLAAIGALGALVLPPLCSGPDVEAALLDVQRQVGLVDAPPGPSGPVSREVPE